MDKLLHQFLSMVYPRYGTSPCFMGKSTISMAIFNSNLLVYQRVSIGFSHSAFPPSQLAGFNPPGGTGQCATDFRDRSGAAVGRPGRMIRDEFMLGKPNLISHSPYFDIFWWFLYNHHHHHHHHHHQVPAMFGNKRMAWWWILLATRGLFRHRNPEACDSDRIGSPGRSHHELGLVYGKNMEKSRKNTKIIQESGFAFQMSTCFEQ